MKLSTKILIGVAVTIFAYFIWPTPWKEYKSGPANLRVNRFTGRTQVLAYNGWRTRSW